MLVRTLTLLISAAMASCSERPAAQVLPPGPGTTAAATPANGLVPMDLSLYTPAELRVFSARCDAEIANALARGDTNGAMGWAKVRSAIAVRLSATEVAAAPRRVASVPSPAPAKVKARPGEYALPSNYEATHVKVWDREHRHWHYEPKPGQTVAVVTPTPTSTPVKPVPSPRPTPAPAANASPTPTLEELLNQYKQLKEKPQ